jgi:hypothetical protein
MSVQAKALIERWQEFKDVAIAEACIQYHEEMIQGWRDTLEYERHQLEQDTWYDEETETEMCGAEELEKLEEDSRGEWSGSDYHNYITREQFRQAEMRDLDTMCRIWKFADDMVGEEE